MSSSQYRRPIDPAGIELDGNAFRTETRLLKLVQLFDDLREVLNTDASRSKAR